VNSPTPANGNVGASAPLRLVDDASDETERMAALTANLSQSAATLSIVCLTVLTVNDFLIRQ
jgi:hypothetical protein